MCHLSIKICENWQNRFCIILLTNKQTNEHQQKYNLHGGNKNAATSAVPVRKKVPNKKLTLALPPRLRNLVPAN